MNIGIVLPAVFALPALVAENRAAEAVADAALGNNFAATLVLLG